MVARVQGVATQSEPVQVNSDGEMFPEVQRQRWSGAWSRAPILPLPLGDDIFVDDMYIQARGLRRGRHNASSCEHWRQSLRERPANQSAHTEDDVIRAARQTDVTYWKCIDKPTTLTPEDSQMTPDASIRVTLITCTLSARTCKSTQHLGLQLAMAEQFCSNVKMMTSQDVTSAVIAQIFVDKFGAVFRILSSFHNSGQFNSHNSRTTWPIRLILVLLCSPGCRGGHCAAKLYNYILHVTQVTYMFKSVELVYRQNYKP